MAPSYLTEIEGNRKPGSADALSRLARALRVPMDDLLSGQQQRREPGFGPVLLRWRSPASGVSESRRGGRPSEQTFTTLGEALAEVREQWSSLRTQSPEIIDGDRLPIYGTEDLLNEIELSPFDTAHRLTMLDISFDDDAHWGSKLDPYPVVIWATASDGELIRCRIERSVFFDCLGTPNPTWTDMKKQFQRYRVTFEKAFRNAIDRNLLTPWKDPYSGQPRREAILTSSNFAMLTNS